jgi:hypothetical protein
MGNRNQTGSAAFGLLSGRRSSPERVPGDGRLPLPALFSAWLASEKSILAGNGLAEHHLIDCAGKGNSRNEARNLC